MLKHSIQLKTGENPIKKFKTKRMLGMLSNSLDLQPKHNFTIRGVVYTFQLLENIGNKSPSTSTESVLLPLTDKEV
jgi:hypothetical protein